MTYTLNIPEPQPGEVEGDDGLTNSQRQAVADNYRERMFSERTAEEKHQIMAWLRMKATASGSRIQDPLMDPIFRKKD